jgi:B9 domain-containing protein 2
MKLPKPEKKPKLVDKKKREAKPQDEAVDPSADPAASDKDPLPPPKPDAAAESPKRKSRWKIPDMKHHNSAKSNNQKEPIQEEEKDPESSKALLSSSSDNNASRENSPSPRARGNKGKRDKLDKRQLSAVESSSGDSEQENQTNVLSPLRRHKPDPDDTLPIPESPYNPYRAQKRMTQLEVPPAYQPEVHLVGEIVSGHGFGTAGGLACKWRVEYGSRWSHVAGDQAGQTQLDYPSTAPWTSDPDVAVWSHPIDLHFATSAFQGWPKLLFQVWRADASMKLHVVGYGFVPVPFAAGHHELWVSLWRPLGTTKEELDVQLLGRTTELKNDDVLFNAAWSERCRLRTVSTGKVLVHIGVLLRHFQAGVIEA